MAYIVADRVKETTTVTGTGSATLAGAASGYRSFASVIPSIGDTCAYAIVNANASEWEVGIGTYSAVNTLTRTTVQASTNANAIVSFTAGVKDVFLAPTANTVLSNVTSNDGTVTLAKTGSIVDLSVAVAAAATNVVVQVRNNTGATLTKGTVVYINDAIGQLPTVAKALATADNTSAQTLGMMSADLANNSNGFVTIIGLITGINTQAYEDGDQLYLSDTVAGTFTKVKPLAPSHLVYVGIVEYKNPSNGKIFVKVQNGYELDELHNVEAVSPSNGQTIVYNSSNQLWEKNTVSLTAGVNGILPVVNGGTESTTASGARTNLGLVIGTDVLAPNGSAASLTNFPTLNQNTTGTAANVTGIVAVVNGGTGVTTSTGTGSNVLSNAPTLTTATFAAGTISASAPNTITQTWNNAAVTFSALTIDITNTASAQHARLLDCYVGASNVAYITKVGSISCANMFSSDARIGGSLTLNTWRTSLNASGTGELLLASTGYIGFCSVAGPADMRGFIDAFIIRDAANTLAQRNGTNAQALRIYNTYTDASNYERLVMDWSTTSNVGYIGFQRAGTGAQRNVIVDLGGNPTAGANRIHTVGTNTVEIWSGNTQCIQVTTAAITLYGGNAYGSGAIKVFGLGLNAPGNANRNADKYVFRAIGFGTGNTIPTYVGFGAAYVQSGITSTQSHTQEDCFLVRLLASATPIVAFGDSFVSTVPAIKRVGTQLQVRLADDSADASFSASYVKTPALTVATLPSASTAGMGSRAFVSDASATTFASIVASGGSNKVPVYSDGTNWLIG